MAYLGKSVERDMYYGANAELFVRAEQMRAESTEAESLLWKELRKFRKVGYVFRRQHPIDIFIADFYCHKIKLVIEVDGEIHDQHQAQEYDDGRSGEMERYEIKVIRFKNNEVINDIRYVLNDIRLVINDLAAISPGKK